MKNCREWLEKWLETNYKEIERKERLSKEAEKRKRQEEERVTVPKIVQVESLVEPAKKSLVNRVPFVIRKLVSRKGKIFPMYGLRCRVTKKKKKKKIEENFFRNLDERNDRTVESFFLASFWSKKKKKLQTRSCTYSYRSVEFDFIESFYFVSLSLVDTVLEITRWHRRNSR